jgi:hypothetical protein
MPFPSRPTSRRHHTVPQFYLRGFADADQVLTVELPGTRRFKQSVKDASVVTDMYALHGHEDGDDVIERELSRVESAAAKVFGRVTSGTWPLPVEDRVTLAYFMAMQATRTQGQRRLGDSIAAFAAKMHIGAGGKDVFAAQLRQNDGGISNEQVSRMWKQAVSAEGPPIALTDAEWVTQMLEMAEKLTSYLLGRPWVLFKFQRRSLVTSDSPVGLIRDRDSKPWEGVGYATAWGMSYPLTRKLGLIMSSRADVAPDIDLENIQFGLCDQVQVGNTETEKLINDHTIAATSKRLYLHPGDQRFLPSDLPESRDMKVRVSGGFSFPQ